ncbi:MAG: RNA polymerase factor sigma-54 [Lactobacillus sp.]|jgi:RNA polymerase sigma-54 factor|nr:RNA polymerase factor sigma-54 [Lactobacillus sp.]MCI2032551.1 RNA polymerase factor sigma-54 [Lactobacillus sp.]
MEPSFSQRQQQAQRLALSPSMRQSITMLQKDVVDLTAYLKEISLENPLFEIHSNIDQVAMSAAATTQPLIADERQQSLYEYLLDQVNLTMRSTPLRAVVVYLIDHLAPSGFLELSEQEIVDELKIPKIMVVDAVVLLQQLDPPGVGARNLQECLLLQASEDKQVPSAVVAVLKNNYDALLQGDWASIEKDQRLTSQEVQQVLAYIAKLTTNPGAQYDVSNTEYIMPDLLVHEHDGRLTLKMMQRGQPQLVFAETTYQELKQSNDISVKHYIAVKRQEFLSLKENLLRRQETLLMVGRLIVEKQSSYLKGETEILKPLLARDVAQQLQVSTSTISRTVANKYIQTDQGLLPLKYFLSRRSTVSADGETVSTNQVIVQLKKIIAEEPETKPYSDEALSKLMRQSGYPIARRTIAKYRDQAKIPSARQRNRRNTRL